MTKTPDYIKRATKKYINKFDVCQIRVKKGTFDRIHAITDESLNAYITRLIFDDLHRFDNK